MMYPRSIRVRIYLDQTILLICRQQVLAYLVSNMREDDGVMQYFPIVLMLQLPLILQGVYLVLCLLVGIAGRNKAIGFWGTFFGSIVLSPVIGLLLVLVAKGK
jgi:hypothetical protein